MKCFTDRALFLFFLFSFFSMDGFAQFESQRSQNSLLPSIFNPAMVGEKGKIQIAGVQRVDFLGFKSGVQATDMSINMPLSGGRSFHGVGLRFANRKTGTLYTSQNAYLQYAYKRKIAVGRLSIGADIGFVNIAFAGTKAFIPESSEGHSSDDVKIPKTDVSGMGLDVNVGLAYFLDKCYFGVSFSHINTPLVEVDDNTKQKVPGILYLHGTYRYDMPGGKMSIYPSTLFKTYFSNFDLDLGARCVYNDKFWGGISYRLLNAFVFSAGLDVGYGISAGLAYDLPTTRLIAGFGSFELFLEYGLERISNKQKKKYKSVRIL